jgi:hypothetical protein
MLTLQRAFDLIVTGMFVAVFGALWLCTRKYEVTHPYRIQAYDRFGMLADIGGIRTSFRTHTAAISFMRQYEAEFAEYDFVLQSGVPIFRRWAFSTDKSS